MKFSKPALYFTVILVAVCLASCQKSANVEQHPIKAEQKPDSVQQPAGNAGQSYSYRPDCEDQNWHAPGR